jgi:hypothetical protein
MPETDPIIAVGLLTGRDLKLLGEGFRRAYLVAPETDFSDLLAAIDAADEARATTETRQAIPIPRPAR